MRADAAIMAALAAAGITTAILGRFDFASETVNVWTGTHSLTVQGSTDTLLGGLTFDPLQNGVATEVGENTYTMQGSEAFKVSLAIPSSPSQVISAAIVHPSEYQARPATFWRALMIASPVPGAQATWAFRRIRAGSMDLLEVADDGISRRLTITIESHAGLISNATNSTYLDQKRFDPADTSQDYAVACQNSILAPGRAVAGGMPATGGYMGGFADGLLYNQSLNG